jgi:predicted RNase H-like HicB family nuclease
LAARGAAKKQGSASPVFFWLHLFKEKDILGKKRYQMQLSYSYWEAPEGGYIGYLNQYPDYWTQGDSIEELERMLISLYGDITQFDDLQPAVPENTGYVTVPA